MSDKAIVYGGKGALGSVLVSHFKKQGWWILSIDLMDNEEADSNVIVDPVSDWSSQEKIVLNKVKSELNGSKVKSILAMAGGWAGGSANHKNWIKNADAMWKQSVWSSSIAASLAAHHLEENGCLILPGAQSALKGTPGMIGYGMAKAAVHHLVTSLASESSGLPHNTFVASICPSTLDTPSNRKAMPDADFSSWTPLEFVANLLFQWSILEKRPLSGSLVQLNTKDGVSTLVIE